MSNGGTIDGSEPGVNGVFSVGILIRRVVDGFEGQGIFCPARGEVKGLGMNPTTRKPAQLDRARERLDQAVARLEAALNARGEASDSKLAKELAAIRSQNAALQEVNDVVSTRLDDAIRRLKSMLKE